MKAAPFSYINDSSDDSNEVCLHITYLFLKALVFVSNVYLLALLSHENLQSLPIMVSSVFLPESTPLLIQQPPLLYSANLFICVFFLICLFILLSLLIFFFQIDRLEPSFTDSVFCFRFRDSVSVSGFRIPCFSAAAKTSLSVSRHDFVEHGGRVISAAKQPEILHVPLVATNDLLSESPNSIFGTCFFLWETMNSLPGTNKLAFTESDK